MNLFSKTTTLANKVLNYISQNNVLSDNTTMHNLIRLNYLVIIIMFVSFTDILIFCFYKPWEIETEPIWRLSIILAHSLLLLLLVSIGIILYYCKKAKVASTKMRIWTNIVIVIVLSFGIVITAIDQYVTPNITPFIVACTVIAFAFLMRPIFAAIVFIAAYLVYYNVLGVVQYNEEILLSNRVNGIAAVGIGFGLSLVLWSSYVINMRQKNHINEQNNDLEMKNRQLEELNDIKDKLFTIITHDIRQPMATVVSFIDLLEDEIDIVDNDNQEIIREVKLQINQAFRIVDTLFDWCRSQKNGLLCCPIKAELNYTVEKNIVLIQSKANEKGISITNEIEHGLIAFMDKEMFDLVLRNILTNAIKFSYRGGNIIAKAHKINETLILEIHDTGIGMDRIKVQNLFSQNNIKSTKGTDGEKGIGIGLHLCKEFMIKNNGDIWIDSDIGKGSIIYLSIPSQ